MKPNHQQFDQRLHPCMPDVSRPTTAPYQHHIKMDLAPSADEVASRVYLEYGNQGSLPEEELQHWLEAEAQLLAASIATRVRALGYSARPATPTTSRHPLAPQGLGLQDRSGARGIAGAVRKPQLTI